MGSEEVDLNLSVEFEEEEPQEDEFEEEILERIEQLEFQKEKQFYENQETDRVLALLQAEIENLKEKNEYNSSYIFYLENDVIEELKDEISELEKALESG